MNMDGFARSCLYSLSSVFVTQMWVVHSRNTHDLYSPPSLLFTPSPIPAEHLLIHTATSLRGIRGPLGSGNFALWHIVRQKAVYVTPAKANVNPEPIMR